ncbi:MAG: ABC transporter permease [Candidatus Promineifilaceae bacterium]
MEKIKDFFVAIWQSWLRIFAFISKEMRLILHQPRLVFSLILGPFLILLVFGVGYRESPRILNTLFVVPDGSEIGQYIENFVSDSLGANLNFNGITDNVEEADRQLRQREVDLVVVTPPDPAADWANDQPSTLSLYHYEIDPLESQYVQVLGQRSAEEINRQVLEEAIAESQREAATWQEDVQSAKANADALKSAFAAGDEQEAQSSAAELRQDLDLLAIGMGSGLAIVRGLEQAGGRSSSIETMLEELQAVRTRVDEDLSNSALSSGLSEGEQKVNEVNDSLNEVNEMLAAYRDMDPAVLVAPFRSETLTITQVRIEPMHFYVPGVIALLLQHLAITLAGLSIIREKLGGAMELIRAAPASALEALIGKYSSYLIFTGLLAVVLTALIIFGLRVPQLGLWVNYALVIIGLLLASLGIGFHISLSAQSNSQAIQYAMLVLLASIFFCGFFMPLYRLAPFVHIISWLLPATYGTVMLQEIMLRGLAPNALLLTALFAGAFLLFLLAWVRLRRQLIWD